MTPQQAYEFSLVAEPKVVAVSADGKGKTDKAETKGKGGTLKGAKKRQTFRALAKQLFSDQDLTKSFEDGATAAAREKSPRSRAKTLATPKDQLAALEKEGLVIPACGDTGAIRRVPSIDAFPPSPTTIRSSRDDSSLPSSRISTTRKKSMEAESGAALVKDDSSLAEKSEADRKFAALLSPRDLASSSPKLDRAKRITVRTNVPSVDLFRQGDITPVPQRSNKTMIKRQAGSGAPGTGFARRPLNFLAPPLPVGETTHSDAPAAGSGGAEPPADATEGEEARRPAVPALQGLPEPIPSPKAPGGCASAEESSEEEDSDLPCLERPTPVSSPAPMTARAPRVRPAMEEELHEDGEAILEELSGLLDHSPASPESATADDAREEVGDALEAAGDSSSVQTAADGD